MFIKRLLQQVIAKGAKSFSVLMLTGPRQAGKTTLLRTLDPQRRFVTLDDLELRTIARDNPSLFLERYPAPILIDEFQYAPQLLPYIKIKVDEKRTRLIPCHGEYWLTGSQNFVMMEGVQESLAGRVAILNLLGFSLSEAQKEEKRFQQPAFFDRSSGDFKTEKTLSQLFAVVLKGDKPEVWVQRGIDRPQYYVSYVQTYLERDVRAQLGVRELGLFEKFMRLLAARCGQLLNMASLASEVGVSIPTIKSWITILERSFQIYLLRPYYRNSSKRQVKTSKVYFFDTGLVAHFLKWGDPKQAMEGPMAGALFENWVVSEVIKSYWHRGQDPNLYFWRTRDGLEVDLVQESGGQLKAAEIKLSEKPTRNVFDSLERSLKGKEMIQNRWIISPVNRNYPVDRHTEVISAWDL